MTTIALLRTNQQQQSFHFIYYFTMSDGVDQNGSSPPPAPQSGNNQAPNSGNNPVVTPSKAAVQMQKMKDANTKYKNLLKMAKERIEQQEIELKKLRGWYNEKIMLYEMFDCICFMSFL